MLILRVFAVERMVRAVIVAAAAYAVWEFRHSRAPIQQAFNHELPRLEPLFNQLGYDLDQSKLVSMIRHAFTFNSRTLALFAAGLAAYAVVEVVEAVGLWLARRWGEYFAMVATSAGLPLEIYELSHKVTWLRAGAFAVNLALVVYLVYAKRLFGVRGGGKAYAARLRSDSIIDTELDALAGGPGQPSGACAPETGAPEPGAREPGARQPGVPEPEARGLTRATKSSAAE
jgi:uncharacterized membrane protein (DUF2068 family)